LSGNPLAVVEAAEARIGRPNAAHCRRVSPPDGYLSKSLSTKRHCSKGTETLVELYDALWAISASPVVALNRALAVAEIHGPSAGS
jgi:RNA polymerase sigma-70 factor (ECF subfamily)